MHFSHEELKKSILSLLKLQEIDGLLFQLLEEKNCPPQSLIEAETAVQESQKALKVVERAYREVERERRGFELRLITLKQDLQKAEAKRRDLKNTKEEFASGKEVEAFQRQLKDLESIISEKQSHVDARKADVDDKAQQLAEKEKALEAIQADRSARIETVEKEASELEARRNEHISQVHDQLFQMYERVQKLRKGSGVAVVRGGVCTGCFVAIPPQQKSLLAKLESLMTCSSCSRILFPEQYLDDEARAVVEAAESATQSNAHSA